MTDNTPRKVAIYCRISRDKAGAGLGVKRQEEDGRKLADQLGWPIAAVLVDNDLSAYSGKPRPAYTRLLEMLRSGEANAVIAWHTDRLHRSPVELEHYITVCDAAGAPTVTVQAGPLDLATPSGRLVARQLGAVARYESEHRSARLRRAQIQMAAQGTWRGGRRPFGYAADGVTLVPAEADAIASAIDAVLSGVSMNQVARDWNIAGITTSGNGSAWTQVEVRRTLLRARNAGLREHKGEIVGPAQWPAIISEDKWRAVRAVLLDPGRVTSPGPERRYLGSGLYLCGVCGRPAGVHATSDGRPVYRCLDRVVAPGQRRHIARDQSTLDRYVETLAIERLSRPDAGPAAAGLDTAVADDATQLHIRIGTMRLRLDELAMLHAEGEITTAQLRTGTARLRDKLDAAESQLAASVSTSPLAGIAGADDVEGTWDGLPLSRRRAIVEAVMVVTILPGPIGRPKGWRPGEPYFSPDHIVVRWL